MNCKTVEEKLPLSLYDELSPEERAEVEAHLAACPRCAATAAELARLRTALGERPLREASPELLVHCRADLEEALDREARGWRGLVRSWLGTAPGQPALRAASALAVLVVGFSLGWTFERQTAVTAPAPANQNWQWMGADLTNTRISGISQVAPDPRTGEVRVTLDAERRVTLEGSLDDPRIQQVLLYAVKSYDNPGIRRDTLEALRDRANEPNVREALLYALRHDPNPGVRLEVLETMRGVECGPGLHRALLETVEKDDNPGVRLAAANMVVAHALDEHDPALLEALKNLATHDASPYVRLKCAKAVRELGQNEF